MLKESYIANWRNLSEDAVKIRVARPSVLAPSPALLSAFMKAKKYWMAKGLTELEARKKAWKEIDYEERFRQEILNNPEAMAKLKEIQDLAKENDVYLICYEKEPPCHRFILIDLIEGPDFCQKGRLSSVVASRRL